MRELKSSTHRYRAPTGLLFGWLLSASPLALDAQAPPRGEPDGRACPFRAKVHVVLVRQGLPLLGSEVKVRATNASITVLEAENCDPTSYPLPQGEWSWALAARPPGSNAILGGVSTLEARLTPDVAGEYVVRFTACPGGCDLPGVLPTAPQAIRQHTIAATDRLVFPPETEPVIPARPPTSSTSVDDQCPRFADRLNAAWLTVKPWHGPADYELLKGGVPESRISSTDNNFNHDSMDLNVFVRPDPAFRRILGRGQGQDRVEVEWEEAHVPDAVRSTRGDQASVLGYWIYDCDHDSRTEIHPPVMLATHRPRAVPIPQSAGYGTNVYVPGIVTELWINAHAGEITGNCSRTGLHQQGGGGGADLGPHACLPQTEGFDPSPIHRVYQFDVYLPRSPQTILAEAGLVRPAVPLYVEVADPRNSGGPEPDVQQVNEGGVTLLRVTLDLSRGSMSSYSRRILAGWAYAAPDNWGLKRWKLRVRSLDVQDDGDFWGGDGDWRFWIITNNGTQEWTKLIECNGCVHGMERFGGTPWETGIANENRSLGPDLLLFPGQRIYLQTAGYENDVYYEDSMGKIIELLPQEATDTRVGSFDGGTEYTMHYQVVEGSAVGAATLSPGAQQLYDAYVITPGNGPAIGKLPHPVQRAWTHPHDLPFEPGQQPVRWTNAGFFAPEKRESAAAAWLAIALLVLLGWSLVVWSRRARR